MDDLKTRKHDAPAVAGGKQHGNSLNTTSMPLNLPMQSPHYVKSTQAYRPFSYEKILDSRLVTGSHGLCEPVTRRPSKTFSTMWHSTGSQLGLRPELRTYRSCRRFDCDEKWKGRKEKSLTLAFFKHLPQCTVRADWTIRSPFFMLSSTTAGDWLRG